MEKMESIADLTADLFIRKHFINLDQQDRLVKIMRTSVREIIKDALKKYELELQQASV